MLIGALNRKLLRDLWRTRGQVLAIAAVISAGVATLVMSMGTLNSLTLTRDAFYADYRFPDVFAFAKRAPVQLETRIGEVPGVARVQTRIVRYVILDMPDLMEPARANPLPAGRPRTGPERGADPQGSPAHRRAARRNSG